MNMCTVKLRNDLIRAQITPQKEKATNTTAGSIDHHYPWVR